MSTPDLGELRATLAEHVYGVGSQGRYCRCGAMGIGDREANHANHLATVLADLDRAATITNTKAALDYLDTLRAEIATLTAQRDSAERRHERLESGVEALAGEWDVIGDSSIGGSRVTGQHVAAVRALLAESAASEEGA